MILCAGLGTRLRPITTRTPKPAVELLNVPLLCYTAELLTALDPTFVVANVHYGREKMIEIFKRCDLKAELSLEAEKPLGSGGGLKHAQKLLMRERGPFLALNGDNVLIPSTSNLLKSLYEFHLKNDPLATLLTVEDSRVGSDFNGVWFDSNGCLREVTKKPNHPKLKGLHFTGVAVYSDRIFKYLPEGESNIFSQGLLPAIAKGEKVLGFNSTARWFETGDKANFIETTSVLIRQLGKNEFLDSLIQKYSPQSEFTSEEFNHGQVYSLISQQASVDLSTICNGFVVIGDGAVVKGECTLENVILLPGGRCGPDEVIKNAILV